MRNGSQSDVWPRSVSIFCTKKKTSWCVCWKMKHFDDTPTHTQPPTISILLTYKASGLHVNQNQNREE